MMKMSIGDFEERCEDYISSVFLPTANSESESVEGASVYLRPEMISVYKGHCDKYAQCVLSSESVALS